MLENVLKADERAYWLLEYIKPTIYGPHRYQRIIVVRNDKLTPFDKDLGPEILFPNQHILNMPSFMEYSVGEVVEMADRLKEGKEPEHRGVTDNMVDKWLDQREREYKERKHITVVGPIITTQR